MAITDWSKPMFGDLTQFLDAMNTDRDATYVGFKPGVLQGFDWKDPNSTINVGGKSFKNPFQYGSAETEYAGLNGLQNTDGWQTYGSGANEYKVYADSQQGQQAGVLGQIGPDGTDANPFYAAQSGNRLIGAIKDKDPELWKVLEPYAKAYGSWTPEEGYTIPEKYYKEATAGLGRWTTKGDWKGPASVISLILSAVGGQLLTGAGLAGQGLSAADIAGLTQMGEAAGLSGGALDAFVSSGGTLGSTAAGGGGIGSGMLSGGSGGPGGGWGGASLSAEDLAGLTQMGKDAGLSGQALQKFVDSAGTWGSTAAGGGGVSNTLMDQLKTYIQNRFTTPEGWAQNAASGASSLSSADKEGLTQMGKAAGLSGSALDAFVNSGGTLGSAANGGGGVGTGANWLNQLLGLGTSGTSGLGSLGSALTQYALGQGLLKSGADVQAQPFTPYNVVTPYGTGAFSGNTAIGTLAPEYQTIRNQAIGQAQGVGDYLKGMSVGDISKNYYDKLEALSKPYEDQNQAAFMDDLYAKGIMGAGNAQGENSLMKAYLNSRNERGAQRELTSMTAAPQIYGQWQQNQGNATNMASGLDAMVLQNLNLGGALGGRAAAQNNFGTQLNYNNQLLKNDQQNALTAPAIGALGQGVGNLITKYSPYLWS